MLMHGKAVLFARLPHPRSSRGPPSIAIIAPLKREPLGGAHLIVRHNWQHDQVVERSRGRVWIALCAGALGAMLGAGIALAAYGAMRPLLSALAGIARQ
jgi:hypothetical protein